MLRAARLLLLAPALLGAGSALAFTFSDGTSTQCIAQGKIVPEFYAPPQHEFSKLGREGMTVTSGNDYLIIWNEAKLNQLPPAIHDLLFFHECAHAQIPTKEELKANCEGLKAMRAANRAGVAIEAQLAKFYGPTSQYWAATLKCANEAATSPAATPQQPQPSR
jgi:hypothetical protein